MNVEKTAICGEPDFPPSAHQILRNWLNDVTNKRDYLAALRAAIAHLEGCDSEWLKTEHVHEQFEGQTVWQGDVEVFLLNEHPKARHAYAWGHLDGPKDDKTRFVVVLEMPPVTDARAAVQASIMADGQRHQS